MINNLKYRLKKNLQIFLLFLVILGTATSATFVNYKRNSIKQNNNDLVNNIFLKKTLNHIINNLDPRYKNFNHKIKSGETFDKILKTYSIANEEIFLIKEKLSTQVNLNKLNVKQSIKFSLDQTNNKIKEFTYQVSSTKKIKLIRNIKDDIFNQEILSIKLDKQII